MRTESISGAEKDPARALAGLRCSADGWHATMTYDLTRARAACAANRATALSSAGPTRSDSELSRSLPAAFKLLTGFLLSRSLPAAFKLLTGFLLCCSSSSSDRSDRLRLPSSFGIDFAYFPDSERTGPPGTAGGSARAAGARRARAKRGDMNLCRRGRCRQMPYSGESGSQSAAS